MVHRYDHRYSIVKKVGQDGGPEAAAVPAGRTQQDAKEESWQKTFELHVEGGKKDPGDHYACPRIPEDPDKDPLQNAAKT
jgi:hypothetical protein